MRIDFSVGETTIKALEASENLIEADLTYVGDIELKATGDQEKVVHLSQTAGAAGWFRSAVGWIGSGQRLRWDIGLTPSIPLNLDIHGGAGRSSLDLSRLQLTGLNVGAGAGEFSVQLPAGKYAARYSGGVGRSTLSVPSGADVDVMVSSGAGEINLTIGADAAVNARISGGVGPTNVSVPAMLPCGWKVRRRETISAGARQRSGGTTNSGKGGVWGRRTSQPPSARSSSASTAASARSTCLVHLSEIGAVGAGLGAADPLLLSLGALQLAAIPRKPQRGQRACRRAGWSACCTPGTRSRRVIAQWAHRRGCTTIASVLAD
ncbi:MAG: hypothetical protein LC121_14010 [Anaerolineae bacterium]|nr:hypothetical protein [Anaerolineae bacterium]